MGGKIRATAPSAGMTSRRLAAFSVTGPFVAPRDQDSKARPNRRNRVRDNVHHRPVACPAGSKRGKRNCPEVPPGGCDVDLFPGGPSPGHCR